MDTSSIYRENLFVDRQWIYQVPAYSKSPVQSVPALVSSVQYRRTLAKLSVSLLESVPKGRDLGSADIRYHVLSSCRSQCPYRKVDIAEQRTITLLSFPVRYHVPRSSLPVT